MHISIIHFDSNDVAAYELTKYVDVLLRKKMKGKQDWGHDRLGLGKMISYLKNKESQVRKANENTKSKM